MAMNQPLVESFRSLHDETVRKRLKADFNSQDERELARFGKRQSFRVILPFRRVFLTNL